MEFQRPSSLSDYLSEGDRAWINAQLEMTRIDTPAKESAVPKSRWLDGPWAKLCEELFYGFLVAMLAFTLLFMAMGTSGAIVITVGFWTVLSLAWLFCVIRQVHRLRDQRGAH
jgi:hypothetical protein